MESLRLILIGIVVGVANVIPGVSGGTLVVVFNIYDKFVNAITLNVKKLFANRKFIVPLFLGVGIGIVLFSKIITILYTKFPCFTNCFFSGLVLGSIPLLWNYMTKNSESGSEEKAKKFDAKKIILMTICFLIGFGLLMTFNFLDNSSSGEVSKNVLLPKINFLLLIKFFVAGIVSAIAMIIPGISGSLLLLMMGVYPVVISSISALLSAETFLHAFFILVPFGLGVLAGLFSGAKIISILLKKVPAETYSFILGLIVSSVFVIFPFAEIVESVRICLISLILIALGFCVSYFSSKSKKC